MDGDNPKPLGPKELPATNASLLPGASSPFPTIEAPSARQLVDEATLLARFEGDLELIKEVARLFLEDSSKRLCEIREALDSRNAVRLQAAAHALKGSIGNFAATAAFEAALQLENMARAGNLADAQTMLHEVESQVADLKLALIELIERPSMPSG